MRGVTRFRDEAKGVEVQVTMPAQQLVGVDRVPGLVKILMDLGCAIGATYVWVGKEYDSMAIRLWAKEGFLTSTHVEVKR